MKLVIDIKEEVYKSIQDNDYCGISNADMYNAIKNGIPLVQVLDELKAVKNYCTDNSNNY